MDREFDIFFFHILVNIETDMDSWKWIYYKPNKIFSEFPGVFEHEEFENLQSVNENFDAIKAEEKCEKDSDCVAISKSKKGSTAILMNHLDLDEYKVSEDKVTLLKITNATKDTNRDAFNAWDELDTCCPKH